MASDEFTCVGRRCFYRPRGEATAGQLVHMIAEALSEARGHAAADALIDVSGMSGFESPGPAFRRWAVNLWGRTTKNELRIAMVAREEHICPAKTGLLVAAEEGLHANIFPSEEAAVAWLDEAVGSAL